MHLTVAYADRVNVRDQCSRHRWRGPRRASQPEVTPIAAARPALRAMTISTALSPIMMVCDGSTWSRLHTSSAISGAGLRGMPSSPHTTATKNSSGAVHQGGVRCRGARIRGDESQHVPGGRKRLKPCHRTSPIGCSRLLSASTSRAYSSALCTRARASSQTNP